MAKKRLVLDVGGVDVSISSPDKVYFAQAGIRKLEVVEYYRAVADAALRANGGRPLVLKRYVNGVDREAFYQKRAPPTRPDWIDTVTLRFPSGRKADEVVLNNPAQLLWCVNLGCIELHVHPVRARDLEHPDELRVDLDPVPGVEWTQVLEVAEITRVVIEELGLAGWPKTSGSRGLHIYCRIQPRWSFDQVRRAALAIAREVEQRAPSGLASSAWWKEQRQGVFLDYNQNARDRTMAGAWSIRPTPDARVSMPLTWDELAHADPSNFTLRSAPARLREVGDPHALMDAYAGDLTKALELVARHEKQGLGDAAWPPHYVKQEGEPKRVQPSRARPVIEIGRAKDREDAIAGLERWRLRYPEVQPHLAPHHILIDRMRGRHSEWTRIRVNLQDVPDELRPAQEALDPDYDVRTEWDAAPEDASELPRVPGIGPSKLAALRDALGVTSVEELEEAGRSGLIRTVKGFGTKTEDKIMSGISLLRARSGQWLSSDAREVAEAVLGVLRDVAERAELTGALRRGVEVVDRVELVAAGDASLILDRFVAQGRAVKERSADTCTIEAEDGLVIRLHVADPAAFGAAWQHATAAQPYRAELESRARARGFALDADGLRDHEGSLIATPDEGSVARRLEILEVPPELREEPSALQLSAADLDALVAAENLCGMVHCHTVWSDGAQTIEEMAQAAEARGYRYLTITDHSSSAFYARGLTVEELKRQWDEIDEVQSRVNVRILKGTEADILADGALDFPHAILERLDIVIASVHSRFQLSEEAMTARLVRAMRAPIFKIWGHPLGRRLLRREPVGLRLDEVLDAAAGSPVAIEINCDPHRLDLPAAEVRAARARGIPFVLSADAHSAEAMDVVPFGVRLARRAGVTADEVLNTLPSDSFMRAVRPSGRRT